MRMSPADALGGTTLRLVPIGLAGSTLGWESAVGKYRAVARVIRIGDYVRSDWNHDVAPTRVILMRNFARIQNRRARA
jgi:hypothetical protein